MGKLTGPVGEYMDPTIFRDRLPQPYRMLDKILAEIVDHALEVAGENEREREEESRNQSNMFYPPTMNLDDLGHVTCYGANQGGSHLFVGNAEGQLLVVHVETQTVVVRSDVHPSPITALDVVTRHAGTAHPQVLLASSSAGLVCVYEVVFQDNVLNLKGTATPPTVSGAAAAKAALRFSPEGRELTLAAGQGAISAYRVPESPPAGAAEGVDGAKEKETKPEDLVMPTLLWVPEEAAREALLCVEGQEVVPPSFHFRMRRKLKAPARPDGHALYPPRPKSNAGTAAEGEEEDEEGPGGEAGDGEGAPAGTAGLYCIWLGHNRMLAYEFAVVKEAAAAAAGGGGDDKDAAAAAAEGGAGGSKMEVSPPVYDWVTPFPITASCVTDDGEHLATGLSNGAVVVWDDHMVQQNEVLPRVDGGVTCVSFADGASAGLLIGTTAGLLYTCDLVRRVILRHEPPGTGPIEAMLLEVGHTIAVLRRPGMRHQVYDVARRQAMGELAPPEGGVLELQVRPLTAADAAGGDGPLGQGMLLLGSSSAPEPAASPAPGGEGGSEGAGAEGGEGKEGGADDKDKPPPADDKDKAAAEEEGGEGEGEAPPAAPAGSATLAVYGAGAWLRSAPYPPLVGTAGLRGHSPMLERLLTDSEALANNESPVPAARLKPVPPSEPPASAAGGSPARPTVSLVASGRLPGGGGHPAQDVYINLPPSRSRSLAGALESTRTHRSTMGRGGTALPEAAPPPLATAPPTDPELAEEDPVSRVHKMIVARGGGRRERRRRMEKSHGDLLGRLEGIATARPSLLPANSGA